jgi:hypothetical protein
MPRSYQILLVILVGLSLASSAIAGGILPNVVNQITIEGSFAAPVPTFLVVFSSKPLLDDSGMLLTSVTAESIPKIGRSREYVAIRLFGKPASTPGRFDYFFGTLHDADRPWNNGEDFHWQDWDKVSPDVWDNVAIVVLPTGWLSSRRPTGITDVTIRRGGKLLYDSRAKESYPNRKRIDSSIKPFNVESQLGRYSVLNLADRMKRFRNDYYELSGNPILQCAYANLGQTEKAKYANRGKNWCSEFASYVFRQNGIMTPDPNARDVYWKNMREFFEQHGAVYSLRLVSAWSNEDKIAKIKPGSFVSIRIGQRTHSLIFTTWIFKGREPITQYTGLSGNNKGMVWAHAPLTLPSPKEFQGMSRKQLAEYDQQVYFGVPPVRRTPWKSFPNQRIHRSQ